MQHLFQSRERAEGSLELYQIAFSLMPIIWGIASRVMTLTLPSPSSARLIPKADIH
jgi:hypothetical protein